MFKLKITTFSAYAILLAALSLMPTENIPDGVNFWDKAQHALAYGIFMLLGLWLTAKLKRQLYLGLCIIAFGLFIEFLQGLTGYRDASWLDAAANSVGVIAAFLLARAYQNIQA